MHLPVSAESTQGFSIPPGASTRHAASTSCRSDRCLKCQATRSVTLRTGSRTLFCLMHLNKCSEKVLQTHGMNEAGVLLPVWSPFHSPCWSTAPCFLGVPQLAGPPPTPCPPTAAQVGDLSRKWLCAGYSPLFCVCHTASAIPQRPEKTKNTASWSGFGFHSKRAIMQEKWVTAPVHMQRGQNRPGDECCASSCVSAS